MSRSAAFSNALSKVSSDKVRERAEGMEQLRTIFQSQTSVENLSSVTDGVGWLQTFQTLFGVVKMERDQCLKRGKSTSSSSASSAAETRLSKAMSLVRWLIERSLTHLNKKVINALFNHLTQIIISPDGRLVRNSMDYIKALKIVVSFAPHLEHLDSASWQHLMSICWDAALGEHLQHNKADWDEDDLDDDVSKESRELEEEEEEEDDSDDNRDVDMTSVNGTARKRKLPSTASSLTSRHGSRQPITPKVLPLSTEITELLSIVPILLAVPNAPILPPPQLPESDYLSDKALPRVAIRILHRVLRFLEERPAETAAHRPVLMTLNMVLGELELNAVQEMIDKAPKILSLLVPLWNTKLKDQLVISLRIILPFLSSTRFEYDKVPEEKRISREVFNDLMQLRDSVSRTTPGRKTMVLDMTYLALRYNTGHEESTKAKLALPLQTPLMSATSDFTDAMVETWATLELMADNLNMLHQHHESTSLRSTATSTGSNKRQRIEEPVADMLSAIALARQVESRLFSLQTMYFFITRHWEGLHVRLQGSITNTLHHLVVDPNPEVQQWADINLAAICLAVKSEHSGTQEDSTDTLAPAQQQPQGQDQWLEIWQLALRKMTVVAGTSSRSAALLLQVIMRNQIVDPVLLITSIEKFMEGVSDQGPIAPYESVCDFMMDCLDIVEQDARLYRLGFSMKVTEWFRTAWMGQEKVGLDAVGRNTLDISSAFNMISRLSGLSTSYQISLNHRPLTSSSIAIRMQKEKHTIDIRNFVLHTTFPPRTFVRRSRRAMPWNSASEVKPRIYSTVQVRALSRLFTLKLQQIDLADGDATNVAKLRGKLDACMLIMLAESSFIDSDPEHPQINFEATCQLLEKILQITLQTNWTLLERATLFIAIDVLFPDTAENDSRQEAASPLLCRPGPASGILSVASIPEEEVSTRSGQVTAIPSLYRQLWRKPKLCDMFRSRSGDFYRLLRGEDLYGSMPVTGYDTNHIDDDFDTIRVDDESMQNGTAQTDDRIAEVIIEGSIRCCLLPKYCLNDMPTPVKDRTILNILIDAEPALFLRLCNPIFSAIRNGFLDFNDDAAGTIYETLQDYLSSYTYSLSSVMRQIAATLIDTILSRLPPITGDSFCNPSGEAAAGLLDWLGANLRKGKLLFWEERLVVIRLYARLIELDPRNIFWSRRETNSPRNDIADPVTLLCRSLEDSDARLRFRLTAIVSRLFQILPGRNFAALYRDCLSNLHTRGFQVEYILSNLVFYLNITCVSAAGRFNALFHIYDTAYERTFTRAHAHAGLQAVISTLQLANISELYLQYATRITQLQFNEEQAPEKLPMQLYGFQSRKQWATAVLSSVGPVALMMNKTWVWERLCGLAGLSKDDGLQRIFSATFGYRLALDIDALLLAQQSSMVSADIAETARKYEKEVASLGDMADIHSHPIDTVSSVIVMPGHEDTTNDLLSILQSQEDGTARYNAFVSLYCRKESPQLELDEVLAPVIHARASVRVMQWIERSNRTTSLEMMLYNVSMQIVGKLDANILVNERMRLMRNLAFFMAYHYRSFIESPVLGFVVLRTATALTQQRDLAIIAFNMISWILPQIEYMKGSESDLVPLLAKLSSVAWIYFTEPRTEGDEQFHQAAVQFLGTLESFLRCLLSTSRCPSTLRSSAFVELLPIWPRELPNESNAMLRSMSRAKLLEIVQRPTIHAQVFALVNQLAVKSSESQEHEMELFSSNVFWQLKDAISEGDIPHSKETSAFLELCYANGGRIRMIDPDTATALRSKFSATLIRSSKARPDAIQTTRDILFAIVDRLSHSHLGTLYRAYQTLCVVASKILREIQPFVKIPSRLQAETALLDTRSPDLRVDHIEFMDFVGIVSASEAWLMRPMHTDRWVREFASVACLESANSGGLLVEAALLLQHDLQLSRQLLPHLLHLLLQKEESVPAPTTRPAIRDALSGYFKRILESTKLPIATKKVVIDILLYLRQQNRPTSLSHLDNDYWVDLNFALVARVALDCKMYATALLYWELHSDSTSEGKENAFQEDDFTLLYEIYNNIDEPDGFYGIPLEKDVKNSLLQRFQHESNWALAFKYYGADLEANGSSAGQLPQLARSLQAFGMDKLALMLFRSGKSSSFNQSQLRLPYDIAWRTQSWDLPATMFVPESSDRSIYAALRAIHRSRDVEETRRVVGNIEREEVISIQTFSLEDVHGLRKKMKELLSLREISRWCNVYLPMVNSEASSVDRYQSFLEVPAHIEPEMTEQIMGIMALPDHPTDTFSIGAKHPIIPIREGRQASFTALRDPSPTEEDVPQKDVVAKATAVENAQATAGPPGMESRLVDIEHRQKRIEELLQQLVRTAGGESTGQQSSREMRRESEISLDM
ncbi:hypothetical protein QFC19_002922 [Naganishia cerealis]|uniref:Uncharacterized protein n=1 Tax=Naganishia cerealis TaxID=610337 RepID=A0ACC2W6E4_9TREE|nr:hypothetical protein QFC19_002922 [Naganishia cerealis]